MSNTAHKCPNCDEVSKLREENAALRELAAIVARNIDSEITEPASIGDVSSSAFMALYHARQQIREVTGR
jgi:hypothetical protein